MKSICKKVCMSNNNAITLIALVITIVILIILAGVSINIVFDEDGIINKAKKAKEMQNIESIKEALELEKITLKLEKGNMNLDDYLAQITTGTKSYKISSMKKIDNLNAEVIANDDYKFLIIDKQNGNVEIQYQGEATGNLTISADQVGFTPEDSSWEVTTVQEALDSLKNM